MEIQVTTDYKAWDTWLKTNGNVFSFLQSSTWANGIKKIGRFVELVQILDGGDVVAQALLDYRPAGMGKYYVFCPKGPVMNVGEKKKEERRKQVIEVLCNYVKNKNCIFLRVEPSFPFVLFAFPFHLTKDINPPATLLLDLAPTPDTLLAAMHTKTRYNIRLAEKKGIRIEVKKSLDILWDLLQKTGERDKFALHPKKTYEEILKLDSVEQLVAYSGNIPVATGCFIRFGETVSYLYGASDHTYRESMAPHLVQWTAILRAREAGATTYDFFGISPSHSAGTHAIENYSYDPKHRYNGVTRFKLGFGGTVYEDPGTFDITLFPISYFLFSFVRSIRSVLHI